MRYDNTALSVRLVTILQSIFVLSLYCLRGSFENIINCHLQSVRNKIKLSNYVLYIVAAGSFDNFTMPFYNVSLSLMRVR